MNRFSCFPFLSLFITSYLLSPVLCDPKTQALINQVCRTTSDFGFCYDILNRNLVSPVTDLVGLTKLTIGLSLSYAKDTETFIQKAKAAGKDPLLQRLYAGCESNYHEVVGYMEGARYDLNRADYKSMVALLQLSSKPIILCQNAIGDVVFQMREKNRQMRVLLSMGLYEGGLF
ncbi:hypothetical protein Pfo_021270 [Paulownia fortunei]|nr:hypothetical protein Pfo_021270 [Paulownia fortunei]